MVVNKCNHDGCVLFSLNIFWSYADLSMYYACLYGTTCVAIVSRSLANGNDDSYHKMSEKKPAI